MSHKDRFNLPAISDSTRKIIEYCKDFRNSDEFHENITWICTYPSGDKHKTIEFMNKGKQNDN